MSLRLAVAAWSLAFAAPAAADLFKCVGADGKVTYQAEACLDTAQERRLKTPMAEASEAGPAGVGLIDVNQAARRISSRQGRPTVVLLYATTCPRSQRMFGDFAALANQYRARGVQFVVLSVDETETVSRIPAFLASRNASFDPVAVKPWVPGSLTRAMSTVGIDVAATWNMPLLVLRDAQGRVLSNTDAAEDLSGLRASLEKLTR
jgi:hypothetical protein